MTDAIAILGGTGDQGLGLALRFARAGRPVWIGSRVPERARTAAEKVREATGSRQVEGLDNAQATARAPLVILSVPFEHTVATVKGVRDALQPGSCVISMGVPLASAVGDAAVRTVAVWQGSCAELVASLLPEGVQVAGAFQNVSAQRLQALDEPVDCDVVVCGAKDVRGRVMELCELVPGLRAVDGGPLANSRYVEQLTGLLVGLSIRHKVRAGVGLRFTGLP